MTSRTTPIVVQISMIIYTGIYLCRYGYVCISYIGWLVVGHLAELSVSLHLHEIPLSRGQAFFLQMLNMVCSASRLPSVATKYHDSSEMFGIILGYVGYQIL